MRKWQWYFCGRWIDCLEPNQKLLRQIDTEPRLRPIRMVNKIVTIVGHPDKLFYTIHGDDEKHSTQIRLGPLKKEHPVYTIGEKLVPYNVKLFRNGKPFVKRTTADVGTEHWVAEKGKIYEKIDGKEREVEWMQTDMTKPQLEKRTQTRYHWEFKGPMRWERMRAAVFKTAYTFDKFELIDLFESFDPTLEATEHGPFQFPDFLNTRGEIPLSIAVMENYYAQEPHDWKPFDPSTNHRIECARKDGRSTLNITIRGHEYVLIFDSGGGASGSPPVLIRPRRYELILTSIEEHFIRSRMKLLTEEVSKHVQDPRMFLLHFMNNPISTMDRHIPPNHQARVLELLEDTQDIGARVQTQIQTLLPALLNKYKECEVRQSNAETLRPKRLPKSVRKTLVTGLRVPTGIAMEFPELIHFIRDEQCWVVKAGTDKCDICQSNAIVMGHCGSAVACLKCWVDSLVETNMTCPFCREQIRGGQLAIVHHQQPETSRKRKRTASFGSEQEILDKIHQKYAHIHLDDEESMRKWVTVLLRTGVLQNGQLPRNLTKTKTLRGALRDFNLLE